MCISALVLKRFSLFPSRPPLHVSMLQILLATGGGHLVLLSVDSTGIHEVSQIQMGSEVACLDITPVGEHQCFYFQAFARS